MADGRDRFLDRWSRRKRGHQEAERVEREATALPAASSVEGEPKAYDEAETAAIVESLPDIETLDEKSDFTAFLQEGVPEALRRRALRKLWRLNPVFANLDGLNDYDEDFTLATSALTQVKTIYKVGKGMIQESEPAEDEPGEAEAPKGESASTAESAADPEPQEQAPAPDPGSEETPELGLAEAELPKAEPAQPVPAEPKTARTGSAAKRRWGRFGG